MTRTPGIILAGGQGSRIGGSKPLLPFGNGVLLDAMIARVRPQVSDLALNIPAADEALFRTRYGDTYPLVIDRFPPGTGPLAGVVAGLEWCDGDWLATFPCDTPFLPDDLVDRLTAAITGAHPVAAEDDDHLQGLCSLWPKSRLAELRQGVTSGAIVSPFQAFEALGLTRVPFPDTDAFFNINTPEDLESAKRR
jgi:molybdopterin-guanine dinucleotide biosynthesis protein A